MQQLQKLAKILSSQFFTTMGARRLKMHLISWSLNSRRYTYIKSIRRMQKISRTNMPTVRTSLTLNSTKKAYFKMKLSTCQIGQHMDLLWRMLSTGTMVDLAGTSQLERSENSKILLNSIKLWLRRKTRLLAFAITMDADKQRTVGTPWNSNTLTSTFTRLTLWKQTTSLRNTQMEMQSHTSSSIQRANS